MLAFVAPDTGTAPKLGQFWLSLLHAARRAMRGRAGLTVTKSNRSSSRVLSLSRARSKATAGIETKENQEVPDAPVTYRRSTTLEGCLMRV
jgi:hypothetical protein